MSIDTIIHRELNTVLHQIPRVACTTSSLTGPAVLSEFSSCMSAHLPRCVPPSFNLSVSESCLPPELLSSFLISSDLGGGREWDEARLYPNPPWIIAACGAQSWATKTPHSRPDSQVDGTNAFVVHWTKCIGHFCRFKCILNCNTVEYQSLKLHRQQNT